jgi:peptidylprolyl isomerase
MIPLRHLKSVLCAIAVMLIVAACTNQTEATLVAEVVQTEETQAGPAIAPEIDATAAPSVEANPDALTEYTTTESGLKYWIIEQGHGPTPRPGDTVIVKYRGTLEDGTEFDSGEHTFVLGSGAAIPGLDEGIGLFKEGTKAELVIPPHLGFGDQVNGPVPANSTLIFEVELLAVDRGHKP